MWFFNLFNLRPRKIKFRARMMTKDYGSASDFLVEQRKEHPESEGWKEKKSYIDETIDRYPLFEAVCEYHKPLKPTSIK